MKKLIPWVLGVLTAAIGILAGLLKARASEATRATAEVEKQKERARRSEANARATVAHQGRTQEIKGTKEARREAIKEGHGDSVLDGIIADNNRRVPDD